MKPGAGGGAGRMQTPSSSDFQHLARDGAHNHPPYGRSQDDLNLTPRSHYANPIMGVSGNWAAGGVHGGPGYPHGRGGGGHPGDFFASNGSGGNGGGLNSHHLDRSPRPLQHMHSRDDLDALRPRKTRRTGPSFDGDGQHPNGQERSSSAQGFLAVSPRPNGNGNGGAEGGFMGERGGYLNTAGVYAGPDEVPPAAPRRLVSRHNTPSRPERSGAKHTGNGGDAGGGDDGGKRGGHLMNLDPAAMDTDGGGGQGFQLAAHGFYAAMSPVVAPGRAAPGFGGGGHGRRGHHRHSSSGTSGDLGAGGSQWRMGEVSPDEPAVLQGDSPSSSRSGGGSSTGGAGGGGILGAGGLGLTAHAMSRMEQVRENGRTMRRVFRYFGRKGVTGFCCCPRVPPVQDGSERQLEICYWWMYVCIPSVLFFMFVPDSARLLYPFDGT